MLVKYIEQINKKMKENKFSEEQIKFVNDAIDFANKKHEGQKRKSGEPYFIHPLETAIYLLEWKMDIDTVIGGIFHDLIEDTETTWEEIKEKFNETIADLVKIVSKVSLFSKKNRSNNDYSEDENKYNIQLFLSISDDPRAIIIKLADRLHNMRTISSLSEEKQKRIANETLNIYANIAGRLGMYALKSELLDLSFQIIEPKIYKTIKEKIDDLINKNQSDFDEIVNYIKQLLKSNDIKNEIKHRIKSVYSTYKKIKDNYDINDVHDVFAIRIITKNVMDCYKVLGLIHSNYNYIKNTFSDYICTPKYNMYQSIHTTIFTKHKGLVEIQIRTDEMDFRANFGISSHWSYKENDNQIEHKERLNKIFFHDFINDNNINLKKLSESSQIFDVFISNNKMTTIANKVNTVLDLAFKFDKSKFIHIKGIKKNGVNVKYDTTVKKLDVIEFEYDEFVNIKEEWIFYVTYDGVKRYIKDFFMKTKEDEELTVKKFYLYLEKKLNKNWVGETLTRRIINEKFEFNSVYNFLLFIEKINVNIEKIVNIFHKSQKISKKSLLDNVIIQSQWLFYKSYIEPLNEVIIKKIDFPNCCNKIPFQEIFGIYNKGVLSIHNTTCKESRYNFKDSIKFLLSWNLEKIGKELPYFQYDMRLKTEFNYSLGNKISELLLKNGLCLLSLNFFNKTSNKQTIIELSFLAKNIRQINNLIEELKTNYIEVE